MTCSVFVKYTGGFLEATEMIGTARNAMFQPVTIGGLTIACNNNTN
jgi:hypothetical protein